MPRFLSLLLPVLTAALLGTGTSRAQTAGCEQVSTQAILHGNGVRAKIMNNGGLFWNGGTNVYDVDEAKAIFNASLIVAGRIDGELRAAGSTYGPWEFWPGPADSVKSNADCERFNRMYIISKADIDALDEGAEPADDLRDWPWRLGAPVVDGDGDPDNYDLAAGDRPELLGREMVWWVMNDVGGAHGRTHADPLGIEVQATAFAATSPDPAIHKSTFYRYRIINRGDRAIEDAYVAMNVDPDLGTAFDDYVGSDSLLSMGYAYNADNDDDDNYGEAPPAIGFKMFDGPVGEPDGYDNDYDGQVDEPGERLRMSAFLFYNGGGGVQGDPDSAVQFYEYMRGRWKDGEPWTFGGDGRDFSDEPIRYMFPADPPEFWSEFDSNGEGAAIAPADRRWLQSMGPFRLGPGEETEIFIGVLYGRGTDNLNSVRELKAAAARLDGKRPEDIRNEFIALKGTRPRLLTPGDGATALPLDAKFRWLPDAPGALYELELRNELTSGVERLALNEFSETSTVFELEPETDYSWRMREYTVDATGPWTERWSFSTSTGPFEGNFPLTEFVVTQNAAGVLDPPVGASADWQDFPTGRPFGDQQTSMNNWFIHTTPEAGVSYADFMRHVVGDHAARSLSTDYEIRFVGTSVAVDEAGEPIEGTLPFEIWKTGKGTPASVTDDVRLIPIVDDADGEGWNIRPDDHPASSRDNDPWNDPLSFHIPTDSSPGSFGYDAFADAVLTGDDAGVLVGTELLRDIVFVAWNGGDEDWPTDLSPEPGTVFRISSGPFVAPALTAPGDGQFVPEDPIAFHWIDSFADVSSIELARTSDFIDLVTIEADIEPGFTFGPLPEGTYYWRIRGSLGLSPTWSFTVAAGVDAEDDPVVPEQFEIGRPYPNPASSTLTLPTTGRAAGAVAVELFDVLGRRLASAEVAAVGPTRLDVAGLSSGVYVLRARADGREWTHPFVIRR